MFRCRFQIVLFHRYAVEKTNGGDDMGGEHVQRWSVIECRNELNKVRTR